MHYHHVKENGELVDLVPFCCDSCHRAWCEENGVAYDGWFGCHEGSDSPEFCACCGVYAGGGIECDCQCDNVVVNRFRSEHGEKCEHGNWLQVPESYLDR